MTQSGTTKWVRLGDYVSEYNVLNTDNKVRVVKSVSVFKEFRDTGAKVDKNELRKYKIVLPGMMSYVQTTKNEKCFACCVNHFDYPIVVTSVNKVLYSNNPEILNIDYLFLILSREEFDRFAIFNSWGSAREVFKWEDLMNVQIPLPSPEVQQKLVDTYNGIKAIAEQNEALYRRLSAACHAYIVDCRAKYEPVVLGEYIDEHNALNTDNKIKVVKSVSVFKEFRDTGAKVNKDELSKYKIVKPGMISYVQTTKNEKCFACCVNHFDEPIVVSAVNRVIYTKDPQVLDIDFLFLFFNRKEFDRYAIFNSWGSAREVFQLEDLKAVHIPLPPIEVQKAIVELFNCADRAKKIATEALERLKTLCPALVQRAANS